MARRVSLLEREYAHIQSDKDGSGVARSAISLAAAGQNEVVPICRSLYALPCIKIKTVRASIVAFTECSLDKENAVSVLAQVLLILVEKDKHISHLSPTEWNSLVRFALNLLRAGQSLKDQQKVLRLSIDCFGALSMLLQYSEEVCFEPFTLIVEAISAYLDSRAETKFHLHAMSCLRLIYIYSVMDYSSLAHEAAQLAFSIIENGPFRSSDLKEEIFMFCCCLQESHSDIITCSLIENVFSYAKSFLARPDDIEFVALEKNDPLILGTRHFRARSLCDLSFVLASNAINILVKHLDTRKPLDSQTKITEYKKRKTGAYSWFIEKLHGGKDSKFIYQCLAFLEAGEITLVNHLDKLLEIAQRDCSFWSLVCLAIHIVPKSNEVNLKNIWRTCSGVISEQTLSSAACFCLSQIIKRIYKDFPRSSNILPLFRGLLLQFDSTPELNSGSNLLCFTFLDMPIPNTEIHGLKERLRKWWVESWKSSLISGTLLFNLDIISSFTGQMYPSLYTGRVYQFAKMYETVFQANCQRPSISLNSPPVNSLTEDFTRMLESFKGEIPRESFFKFMSICALYQLDSDFELTLTLENMFESDFKVIAVCSRYLTQVRSHLVKPLCSILDSIMIDDEFKPPFRTLYLTLSLEKIACYADLEVFPRLMEHNVEIKYEESNICKLIGSRVLGDYKVQRLHHSLETIIDILKWLDHGSKMVGEIRNFLLGVISSQSRYSLLRFRLPELFPCAEFINKSLLISAARIVPNLVSSIQNSADITTETSVSETIHNLRAIPPEAGIESLFALVRNRVEVRLAMSAILEYGHEALIKLADCVGGSLLPFAKVYMPDFMAKWVAMGRNLLSFPVNLFDISDISLIADVIPTTIIEESWPLQIDASFASWYVLGLNDPELMDKLEKVYGSSFADTVEQFAPKISLVKVKLAKIVQDDFWSEFPDPFQSLFDTRIHLPSTISDLEGEFLITQLLGPQVYILNLQEKYTVVRQCSAVFHAVASTEEPRMSASRIIRELLHLLEKTRNDLSRTILKILQNVFEHATESAKIECLCALNLAGFKVDWAPSEFTSMLTMNKESPLTWLRLIKPKVEFLESLFAYFFDTIEGCQLRETVSILELEELSYWAEYLGTSDKKVYEWFIRESVRYKNDTLLPLPRELSTDAKSAIGTILQRIQNTTYWNFSLFEGLRNNLYTHHPLSLPRDLWKDPQSFENHLYSAQASIFGVALFDLLCSDIRLSQPSIHQGLLANPCFARDLVPLQVQRFYELDAADSTLDSKLQKVLEGQLYAPAEVKTLVLKCLERAYVAGRVPVDQSQVAYWCNEVGEGPIGLMFLELHWSETNQVDFDLLISLLQSIDTDPDVKFGARPEAKLEDAVDAMSPTQRFQFHLSKYELDLDSSLAHAELCDAGFFRMADAFQVDLRDYRGAWHLEQWDLPPAPQEALDSNSAILFNLMRSKKPDFELDTLYLDCWKRFTSRRDPESICMLRILNDLTRDLSELEIVRPLDKDQFKAYRLACERNDNRIQLVNLSIHEFKQLRSEGKIREAYMSTRQLLSTFSQDPKFQLIKEYQSAQTLWEFDEKDGAINMLKACCNMIECENRGQVLIDFADLYATLAEWSHTAHNDPDSVIISKYYETAAGYSNLSSLELQQRVFLSFARFCESKLKDSEFIESISQARNVHDSKEKELADILRHNPHDVREAARLERVISKERQMFAFEKKELKRLLLERELLRCKCVEYYMRAAAVADDSSSVSRFTALWFSFHNLEEVQRVVSSCLDGIASYKLVPWINQYTSRLGLEKTSFQKILWKLVSRTISDHPYHCIYQIYSLRITPDRTEEGTKAWKLLRQSTKLSGTFLSDVSEFCKKIVELAQTPADKGKTPIKSFSEVLTRGQLTWWKSNIATKCLPVPTVTIPLQADANYSDVPCIVSFEPRITVAGGLSAPKILTLMDSESKTHRVLIKGGNDDLRQDCIMEQVFKQANDILCRHPKAHQRQLRVRSYNVVPLGPNSGVIEFVQDTKSLHEILESLHLSHDDRGWNLQKCRKKLFAARSSEGMDRLKVYEEICQHARPVFRLFFFDRFKLAEAWLKARTLYSRSTASISILGHILGLGDRHCNNILVDECTGEVVHIDLGISFDQGKFLRVPETVPFRLTRDIVDGMGVCGVKGVFTRCSEITLDVLRQEADDIMTVLEVLRYDPFYSWTASRFRRAKIQGGDEDGFPRRFNSTLTQPAQAERALLGVRNKLSRALSCEATVRDLIQQATRPENLCQLFEGWCPFY